MDLEQMKAEEDAALAAAQRRTEFMKDLAKIDRDSKAKEIRDFVVMSAIVAAILWLLR